MSFKIFFSKNLVSEANFKLSNRKTDSGAKLPREVSDIIYSSRQSTEDIRSAFKAASLRLKKA